MQKEKAIWKHCRPMGRLTMQKPALTALAVRLWTCSTLIVRCLMPLLPFLLPVLCSSLSAAGRMSTWSCQTWTRVHERAWGKKKSFSVISRGGTVGCSVAWGSLQIGARVRAKVYLTGLTSFRRALIASRSNFLLAPRCQNALNVLSCEALCSLHWRNNPFKL